MLYVVELLERDSDPERVFLGTAAEAVAFIAEWIEEPLGLTIAIRQASDRECTAGVPGTLTHT